MMTQTIIDSTIFSSIHPDVSKRLSLPGVLFSIIMLLTGVFVFASVFRLHDKDSALSMALMVGGAAFVLFGLFRLFWKSKELVYLPTGSVAKELSLFFDLKYLDELSDAVTHNRFGCTSGVKCCGSGNVRMDIMLSQDSKFAAVQLFQFVPYSYMPVTPVRYLTGDDAAAVAAFLVKCKTL